MIKLLLQIMGVKRLSIIAFILTLLVGGVGFYIYTLQKNLDAKVLENNSTVQSLKSITDEYLSCTKSMERLIESNKKKHSVIREYEKKYKVGEKSEIKNIDDFINFTNSFDWMH